MNEEPENFKVMEWLERVRAHHVEVTAGMSVDEELRYWNERARTGSMAAMWNRAQEAPPTDKQHAL